MNELGGNSPEGALLVADNINISRDGVAEPRRGLDILPTGFTDLTDRAGKLWQFQDYLFAHHGPLGSPDTISYTDVSVIDDGYSNTWTALSGSYSTPEDRNKIQTVLANQSCFFTTDEGVYKLDGYGNTPSLAGAYKGLDVEAATTGSSGFLDDGYGVAYRITWQLTDANNIPITGAPSQRAEIENSAGGSRDITVTSTIPVGVTTDWVYQIFRSAAVSSGVTPSDDLALVYEGQPDGTDISNGYISITDITPEATRGAALYTNSNQEGLANQNERPPKATDIAFFKSCVFYSNTTSKNRITVTLLSIGSPNGLVSDDTVTIAGQVYTGKSAESIGSKQFKVFTGGSASQNIRDTANSLIKCINRNSSSSVYGYYLSGVDDTPGKIMLEERGIGGASFTFTSSRTSSWNPPSLPQTSSNDRFPNGLFWSKPNQPEAVPLVNFAQVGAKDYKILRIVPLKDALLIFKEEEGLYKLYGEYPQFTIEKLDSSAKLISVESPDVLNNRVFCLTDIGICAVSDDVAITSRPIEQTLLELLGADDEGVRNNSWGMSYESNRKYYFFTQTSSGDSFATQAFVYDVFTMTWTRHILSKTTGVVIANQLYFADADSSYINKERKTFTYRDYVDFGYDTSISAVSSSTITLDLIDDISIGDVLYQSATKFSVITAVDTITQQITVEQNPDFEVGSCSILKAIATKITWLPIVSESPAMTKKFHTAEALFKRDFIGTGYLTFASDLSPNEESHPIVGRSTGTWGLFLWGQAPWGGQAKKRGIRTWIPRNKIMASQLTVSFEHAVGYSAWELQGIAITGTLGSDITSRGGVA